MDTGSAKKKKHRRSKSNLQTQAKISGSTDQLLSGDDDPRVIKARQRTKARFESFLQDAVAEDSIQSSGKKKKKKRTHTADSVLETIRAGSPIAKTPSKSEESLIQANLYKEDNTSPGKESKASYRSLMQGKENNVLSSQEFTPKKSKSRRPKSSQNGELSVTPGEKDQSKRRKKTRTPAKSTFNEDSGKENLAFEDEDQRLVVDETEASKSSKSPKRRGERVRRKLHHDGEKTRKRTNDDFIFSVTVHRADRLKPDLQISHPMVRVHVVDSETGNYVKKSSVAKNVTSFYESKHDTPVDYIMPVMTQPFDFKTHKSVIPSWEEVLIFNESYSYFLSLKDTDPKIIIFFEVVDFLSMTASNRQQESEKGWYLIAWAFLKVVGGNGTVNTDRKVRLQLFYPYRSAFRNKNPGHLEVYHWWKQSQRVPYPSTLYVTLKGVQPPKKVDPALRSMYAIQQEKGRVTFEELTTDAERRAYGVTDSKDNLDQPPNWTRLPGQVNRIPNKQMLSLRSGKRGCFVVKFSHNGRYLACGCADMDSFPVIVYEIPSGNCRGELLGHFSIIYDLCWSADDSELISSSSDGTVRMWDTKSMMTSFIKVFPHPCFVYSAQYHPTSQSIIVTGGYDRLIRVWTSACEGINGLLVREVDGHTGFINSICFGQQGGSMFSADSTGSIIMWQTSLDPASNIKRKKRSPLDHVRNWTKIKHIKEEELQGNVINSLVIHPSGLKLLVHTRNSALYMLDLRSFTIMTRYLGASNFKEHIHSTLSACGSFVFSGSEDGVAYVWNTETGDIVSVYTSLTYENAVSDVDFHPLDHMIVFCSFGNNQPVLVYKYDSKAAKVEAKRMRTPPTTPIKVATPVTKATSQEESTRHLSDVTQDVIRMQRVRSKLDSVLETPGSSRPLDTAILKTPGYNDSYPFQTPTMYQSGASSTMYPTPATPHPGQVTFQLPDSTRTFRQGMGTHDTLSTWGSDFSPTGYGTTPGQIPSFAMSPHSQQHLGSSGRFQSRQLYNQMAGSPVDTPGSPVFRNYSGSKRGSLSMNLSRDSPGPLRMSHLSQKPTFSFNAGDPRDSRSNQPMKRVLVMYPYEANRADELTIQPGDVITVLYQDNENWWMGELADGRQGYFPSNYVMQQDEMESDIDIREAGTKNSSKHKKTKDTKMTAVTSKAGELRIISGPEDSSDAELSASQSIARQRRRHRQSATPEKTLKDKKATKLRQSPA